MKQIISTNDLNMPKFIIKRIILSPVKYGDRLIYINVNEFLAMRIKLEVLFSCILFRILYANDFIEGNLFTFLEVEIYKMVNL